jgi:hypothetical protein
MESRKSNLVFARRNGQLAAKLFKLNMRLCLELSFVRFQELVIFAFY